MASEYTGGEVHFRARNERMPIQDEHHFRLRHQYHFGGKRIIEEPIGLGFLSTI